MKVWIVQYDYGYEGESLAGVFSTEEKALKWKAEDPFVREVVYQASW
jgi:hypothetical protein